MVPDDRSSLPSALTAGTLLAQAVRDSSTRLDQAFAAIGRDIADREKRGAAASDSAHLREGEHADRRRAGAC
jgi:hypothetical protein